MNKQLLFFCPNVLNDGLKTTLDIYLKNAVGIGEHPQHFEEMDKLVCAMASTKDNLMTLNDEYGESDEPQLIMESYGGTDPE